MGIREMFPNRKIIYLFISIFFFNCALGVVKISSRLEPLDSCGGEYSGYQYTIVSPNYPDNYPENENCIYTLRGSPHAKCNQTFHLRFLNFSLHYSYDCQKDFLEIGDKSVFCGNVVGIRNYTSVNNTLKLRFHSDYNGSDRGFKILVTTLPCPDVVKTSNEIKKIDCNTDNPDYQKELVDESKSIIDKNTENINYKNIYPVYRPNNNIKRHNDEVGSYENDKWNSTKLLLNHFQPPTNDAKLFRNKTPPTKISTYLFTSPENYSPKSHVKKSEHINNKDDVEIIVPEPSSEFLLPTYQHTQFNKNNSVNQVKINQYNFNESISRNNEKFIIPVRPNNIPPGIPYAPLPGLDTQIKTGEVLDNVGENNDCNGKTNIDTALQVSANTREGLLPGNNYLPSVFASRPNTYPATIYGAPGSRYPPTQLIPNIPVDPDIIIDSKYNFPNLNYPKPNGFIPTQNIPNIFPGIIPNYNPNNRQCCNNNYATQRSLLASPNFPSLFYSANSYQCIYTIKPFTLNICRIRFNLKYFNYGDNDQYCTNGYIEIDRQRYCGCKTGLTIVTNVINSLPKIIDVNYFGYPRSKFNGFLIEVTQELCSNNYYPNLSRSKKAINNTLVEELKLTEDSKSRNKRQTGYSYPRPDVPFNPVGVPVEGQFLNPGSLPVGNGRCQTFNFVDWTLAAKETHLRGAKCIGYNGNDGLFPGLPDFVSGNISPGSSNGYPNYPPPGGSNVGFPNYLPPGNRPEVVFPGSSLPQPPNYPSSDGRPPSLGNCQLITVSEGTISSPGYSNLYPNNVNLCYRFLRIPNGCSLRMTIVDFDVENSPGCVKDYLLFSNQNSRYCGRSLTGTKNSLEFPRDNIIDVRFVTDSYGSGRGFNIGFVQVPCKVL